MGYLFQTFKFNPSVASFEKSLVVWFHPHVFMCKTATEQLTDTVTTVGLKMTPNLHVNT